MRAPFSKFEYTQNMAFKREVISIVGNFDPWFTKGGEDLDFFIRLKKKNIGIYYNPAAVVYHFAHRFSLRKAWRDGRSRAQNLIKHGSTILSDAFIAFFHAASLLALLTPLVAGHPKLAFLIFIPSLIHRLYRAAISMKQGNTVLASLLNSFAAYISHVSFMVSLLSLALKRIKTGE